MLDAKLVVIGGKTENQEITLSLPMVIGRGSEADLVIPDGLVSRRHAELFEQNGRLFVKDLGSLNGTFVNNQRIEAAEPLPSDQLLTLGTVTFRAIYADPFQEREECPRISQPVGEKQTIRFSADPTETISLPPTDVILPAEKIPAENNPAENNPAEKIPANIPLKPASGSRPAEGNQTSRPEGLAGQPMPRLARDQAPLTLPSLDPAGDGWNQIKKIPR